MKLFAFSLTLSVVAFLSIFILEVYIYIMLSLDPNNESNIFLAIAQ